MDSTLSHITRPPDGLSFHSWHFFVFACVAVAACRLTRGRALRAGVLLVLNLYFFFQVVSGLVPFLFLCSVILLTFAAGEVRVRRGGSPPAYAAGLVVALLWSLLFLVKDPACVSVVNPFHRIPVAFVGLSYIIFRCIHYVMDAEALERRGPVTLGNFVLFFPTLLAGPLDRYDSFQRFQDGEAVHTPWLQCFHRIANGLIKKYVLADNLAVFGFFAMPSGEPWPGMLLWVAVFSQVALLYLDFSGYCDIAVGMSRLMGFPLVENFDRPWLAADIQEFWGRWNVSVSNYFKDYCFTPLSHLIVFHVRPRWQVALLAGVYFVTMVVIALWHGLTWGFFAFGAVHGLALAGSQLWRRHAPPPPARAGRARLAMTVGYAVGARVVLYGFLSITLVMGYCGIRQAVRIVSALVGD